MLTMSFGGLLATTSCENFLEVDTPSNLAQDAVFSSVAYTNSAVTGVYNKLIGDNGYGSRISILYGQGGEDFKVGGAYNSLDRRAISGFGIHPDNTEMNLPFIQMYEGIQRANVAIKYIPASALYTSGTPTEQATMRRLYGEVLTLRAQFYHELIRNWGDVPAHFEPSEDVADLYLPKTDRDIIYDRLLDDLATAAELVPWRTEAGATGQTARITKAAVKGLRARIALARGGYSLRRESNMMERRADYLTYYQIAREECWDIMQRRQDHDLNPSYENIFRSLHSSNRQDPTNELIWEVGAFGGNARTDSKLGYGNGIRINQNSSYGTANGGTEAIPTYFYEFDSIADVRRDVTIAYFTVNATDQKEIVNANEMRDGKFRKYWTSINGTNQTLGINWPLLRFADVLLMYAETENELNGPTASAISAYEEVRKRAYIDQYEDKMGPTPTDKEGFFRAIVQERLLEFGAEGIRKYDLIRWNLLNEKIQETRQNLTDMMNGVGRYSNVPMYIYQRPNTLLNAPTVREEMADLDLLAALAADGSAITGPVSQVFYQPEFGTSGQPTVYVRKNWRAAVTEDRITGAQNGFAIQFQPNRKELFPIYSGILNQNYNLTQDYGY